MGRTIFFMGESTSSYMMISIKNALEKAMFDVVLSNLNVKDSDLQAVKPDILLMLVGDYLDSNSDFMNLLRNYSLYSGKKVHVVGYKDEIVTVTRYLKIDCVGRSFERPLNMNELVSQLEEEAEKCDTFGMQKHILVVDDSGTSLRAIKGWLEKSYRISVASSAAMAISFLTTQIPDLILLDYEMPICSGPQFLEMIMAEEKTASIPVIFLTSKDDANSVASVLALKPAGYLLKTLPPDQIVASVDEFFEKHR